MTSAVASGNQNARDTHQPSSVASGTTSPLSGAVPAQHPARSYATATKTAAPITQTPAGASTQAQNAKTAAESPVNGTTPIIVQGGSQAASNMANGNPGQVEHGRKPSVVISAAGASGYTPNGGLVGQNGTRPPISFGSMNPQGSPLPPASTPNASQTSSLPAPMRDPRVISPTHSPSPIPQPPASGGRPPSSIQNQGNAMQFGSIGGDNHQMQQTQMPTNPHGPGVNSVHERRQSSHSMQSDMSNASMNRNFPPPSGRGRGYPQPQPYGMHSPGPGYRQMPNQPRNPSNMGPQFQQQIPPGSPYNRGTNSPALNHPQPNMPPSQMGGNPQMHYGGYQQHVGPQHQVYPPISSATTSSPRSTSASSLQHVASPFSRVDSAIQLPIEYHATAPASNTSSNENCLTSMKLKQGMYNIPHYDPQSGYYQPYYQGYPHYGGQAPPQSPRPYPSPFPGQQGPAQPPFHPQNMSRSTSQASERPPSGMDQPQTPSMSQAHPSSQTSANLQGPPTSTNFVKPSQKKSNAIKITDVDGNPLNFAKSSPSPGPQAQSSTPVIVSTPNAPTPPPRAPSNQHVRAESKSTKSAEERKSAFQEQVKRQMEEKRRQEEEEAAKAKQEKDVPEAEPQKEEDEESATKDVVKEAAADAEKAAAVDAADKQGEEAAEAASNAITKEDGEKTEKEETEDERLEREIAEIEAAEREEEERQKAYEEKKRKQKEEAAKLEGEKAAKQDEELKRQEREAELLEEQREREREAEKTDAGPDQTSKDIFASLKKPTLGPGASAPDSGTETPASEDADQSSMPPPASTPQARSVSAQKNKPAHLKLETAKRVEPAEPTPGMQSLKSARFLELQEDAKYPDGFKSPNPALNLNGSRKGRAYNKEFLLQFQNVFKEKPSVDWDLKVRETLGGGDEPGSARSQSARTPSTNMSRSASGRPGSQVMSSFGPMGNFGGGGSQPMLTLPPGTTSQERFRASQIGARSGPMPAQMGRVPSQLGMGPPPAGMSRTNSLQAMANMGAPNSPRQQSSRGGKGGSRRGDRTMSRKEEADLAAKMPLTAHVEVAPLEKSTAGWKPTSIGAPMAGGPDPSGNMAPDLVQRKVKAALNKMTPEKFEKISDQILEIASQSKNESDGRTLRQVIQLTFEKACDEAHWAGMYAQFCHKMLTAMSTEIRDETIKDKNGSPVVGGALFRKYLLNRCQEEFERGWQVNLPDKPDGETGEAVLLSDEYYIAAAAKRKGLGLIQFIGQLYKLKMLTLRIMHECVMKLLNFEGDPDEAAVENLTTLLKSVGSTMEDDEQGRQLTEQYFQRIDTALLKSDALPSRPKFMILDLVDLRKAGWKGKDDSKGPKTIQQIHEEALAAQAKADAERQRTSQRGPPGGGRMPMGRGDARSFSGGGMQPPVDYSRTTVGMDDLRRLQNRGSSQRQTGGSLGPNLGPSSVLNARSGSRRGAGNLGAASSGNTTRTNTPPVDSKDKKDEPAQQNAFSALASLDPSGEVHEDAASQSEAASPPAVRNRSKSPLAAERAEDTANV